MPARLGYQRPFEPKYMVSGPAPPGRIFDYVQRIKRGEYRSAYRGRPTDPDNLDHWTVCFMVGLWLVEAPVPPPGSVTRGTLRLTGNGERLCTLLRRVRGSLPEGRSAHEIETIVSSLRSSGTYDEICGAILESPAMKNFQLYLATEGAREIQRTDRFYLNYGKNFGIRGTDSWTARNRVPSALQMAQVCGVVGTTGRRLSNRTEVAYAVASRQTQARITRAVGRRVRLDTDDARQELARFLEDESSGLPKRHERTVRVLARNLRLSSALKKLYGGRCQICRSSFDKRDGTPYSEGHHLIPLGQRGADSSRNVIVLCATCHRKMHYAEVRHLPESGGRRYVVINGETAEIRYSPEHRRFLSSRPESSGR